MRHITFCGIALAVCVVLSARPAEAQPLIPEIFDLQYYSSNIIPDLGGRPVPAGGHADSFDGIALTPLRDIDIIVFTSPYYAAEIAFDVPDASILSQSVEFDRVHLQVEFSNPTGFLGEFDIARVLYSEEQQYHTNSFDISGTTVNGHSFAVSTDPVSILPEPSCALLMFSFGIAGVCQRKRIA